MSAKLSQINNKNYCGSVYYKDGMKKEKEIKNYKYFEYMSFVERLKKGVSHFGIHPELLP